MNFKDLSDAEKKEYANLMFQKLSSAEELKNWVMSFLGLEMPIGQVDPDSNSSPIDAMWEIYENVLNNRGDVTPGYIMLSARECYKCQVKGSKLLTKSGLVNIEDVKIGDTVWSGFSWQKVTNHIYDGFKAGITVEVDGGLKFTGSPIHRYWTLRDGQEQWIRSDELDQNKDLIAVNVNTGVSGPTEINQDEYDTGYFLGLLAGDGSVSAIDSRSHRHFVLTTIDDHVKDFFFKYVEKKWGCKVHNTTDGIGYAIWDKTAIDDIKILGVKAARSWEKQIPEYAYTSISAMKGFIAGLFDTDGSYDRKGHLVLSITALSMLQDMQKALVSFGVLARVRSNKKKYGIQNHLIHSLTICHSEIKNLLKTGIQFKAKKANKPGLGKIPNTHDTLPKTQVQWFLDLCDSYGYLQIRNREFKKRSIGSYSSISVDKLSNLCSWMEENIAKTDKVSADDIKKVSTMRSILKNKWLKFELKNEENVEFYDLTVENDHSYWSNGSISHNTLGAAILETLLMLHFQVTIAHMAAIQAQSAKAVQYINYFFAKVEPLLEVSGWTKTSENKNKISFRTDNDEDVYIRVIVATMAGANSEHTSLMFVDEIDVVANPQAYEEAKLIPGYTKGIYPVTVKLSTRKFAFGLMQKEIDMAPISGDKILRWNILDVTERCPETRHKPEKPKKDMYVAKALPLRQIEPDEYDVLSDPEKPKWERIDQVHAGCVNCKLLPVCKTRLATRDVKSKDGLYKPIASVINQFKKVSPDMAEAQLLCWKPSSKGLVYPRFEGTINAGNVITLEKAWEIVQGEKPKKSKISEIDLIYMLKNTGIRFFAGVDWGYLHDFVIVIFAQIPNGEYWVVDCYSAPGLEFSDCLEVAKGYRDKYGVDRWFCDTAMPSHLKSFNKNGMKSPQFTKDVMGGIESLRSKIVDGNGRRLLKVLYTDANQRVINAFQKHHFKLGSDGNPTLQPDDTPGVSDQADAMRYVGQNLFPIKGPQKPEFVVTGADGKPIDGSTPEGLAEIERRMQHNQQMKDKLGELVQDGPMQGGTGRKGGFFWTT